VHEIGGLTEPERVAMEKWSRRDHVNHLPPTVREAFEAQARRSPEKIAVASGEIALTYRSLDRRANNLAWRLHNLGARVEKVVAVCLPPSPALVLAALSAMKAGAAYLPIDPAQPIGRLQELLEDLDPVVVIADEGVAQQLDQTRLRVMTIDVTDIEESEEPPAPPAPPNALAYVIFTSGSTGRPKAAAVPQVSFRSFVGWLADDYRIGPSDICSQIVSPSFDASISEVWPPLVSGATLIAAPRGLLADPERLAGWLSEHSVTCCFAPTSIAMSMVRLPRLPKHLRLLLTGGEAFSGDVPDHLPFELVNQYGPAECSFIASRRRLAPRTAARGLSIGQPTGNVRLYLLDDSLRQVAPGVSGELYIGGLCVGRGYLSRPTLTAAAYLPDPFTEMRGARMYRTGDVASWQADGTLRFIGRADRQVKISGCRVEPAEVESTLMGHPGVMQAAVVAGPTPVGELGLAAHVIPRHGHAVTPEELRGFLDARLPRYMVPGTISLTDSFPRLTSGKVDRSRLPSPREVWQIQGSGAALTATESKVADICSTVLGVPVGRADDLFALGATSLQLVRAQLAIQRALGIKVPIDVFFDRPAVSAFAQYIDAAGPTPSGQTPPIPRLDPEAPGPLALAQTVMIALHNTVPDSSVFNVLLAVRFDGELDEASLDAAIDALWERHPVFRTNVKAVEGMIRQVPSRAARPWFHRCAADSESEVRNRALELLMTPFDLAALSLLRAELIRLPDHSVLLLSTHHAFLDGWSTRLILRDLGVLYRAHQERSALPALPFTSFAAFARWQRDALEAGAFDDQIGYWVAQLGRIRSARGITDGTGPRLALRTAHQRLPIEKSVMAAVRACAVRWGVSEYVVHLTTFALTIASFSQSGTAGVAILTENRARPEIEDVVGLFANTLPLSLPIDPDLPLEDSVRLVRTAVVEAQVHQEAPIDAVVERATAAGIDPAVVQALFLFQDVCSWKIDFGDARAELIDVLGEDSGYLAAWRRPTGFPVALLVESGPEGGILTLLYHPTLVSGERASEILHSVRTRLEKAASPIDISAAVV
jgi:amino acid adenylation domain-containing protein